MVHAMLRGIHRHERDDGREHEHQAAEAVDTEVILDAERRRPRGALHQTDAAIGRNASPDEQRNQQAGKRCKERNNARVTAGEKRDGRARERQHREQRQDWEPEYVHGRLLQRSIATSATTAAARMRR